MKTTQTAQISVVTHHALIMGEAFLGEATFFIYWRQLRCVAIGSKDIKIKIIALLRVLFMLNAS